MYSLRIRKSIIQFTHFSLIGSFNGMLDLAALNLLLWLWPTPNTAGLFLINSVAYALAVLNSYIWNSRLTFRKDAYFSTREKTAFAAQAVVSLLISNIVFVVFAQLLGLWLFPQWIVHNTAKLLSMLLSSISSFFFMKYFVFRSGKWMIRKSKR